MDFTDSGSGFVYGYLVNQSPFNLGIYPKNETSGVAYQVMAEINNGINVDGATRKPLNSVFVFKILSVIFFFSFMVSMLFHLGTMQCKFLSRMFLMANQHKNDIICQIIFKILKILLYAICFRGDWQNRMATAGKRHYELIILYLAKYNMSYIIPTPIMY